MQYYISPKNSRTNMRRFNLPMISSLILLLALSANAKPIPESGAEKVGMSTERLTRVTEMTQRYVNEGKMAGIVTMVAREGRIVHFEAVGNKGVDDERALEKTDLFRIYSMSKPITAVALMQLYEQGKFHLNDLVTKYVPELKDMKVRQEDGALVDAESEITMHQLLTHTTGLGYGLNTLDATEKLYAEAGLWESANLDEFAEKVGKLPLRYQPGAQWHYSIAVDITGLVVQRLSGMPFDKYLQKNIFEPLAMVDTFFEVPADKLNRFLPNHYLDPKTGKLTTIEDTPGSAMRDYKTVSLFSGGGGLVSSTMDYMRFCIALRNGGVLDGNRILGEKTIKYMTTNHLPASLQATGSGEQPTISAAAKGFGFGLGFGVTLDPVLSGTVSSKGNYFWGGAAGTAFWIDPEEDIVVVAMMQRMRSPRQFRPDLQISTYQAITESKQ
jgi:CubicO group peptidase (beta-lactamase class C family)